MHSGSSSIQPHPKPSWRTRLPFFYGWVIVGSSAAVLAVAYGLQYSFSVFFVAMIEEFGWSRALTSGVFSVWVLVIGFAGVGAGILTDRFGPDKVVAIGGVILALGLVATSQLTELWQFYLYFGVLGAVGQSMAGWVPCIAVLSLWFSRKRGVAIGIASAGIGLGTLVMAPLCQYLISTVGWRYAFLAMAGMALFIIVPQAPLMVRRPEDLGLRPDGGSTDDTQARLREAALLGDQLVVDRKWASYPWTVATAMRTSRYWLLAAGLFFCIVTNQMLWVHQVAYLVDGGYDKMLAASAVSIAGFVSMPTKIMWGAASDRFGREITFTLGLAIMVCAVVLLVLTWTFHGVLMVALFAAAFATGYAVSAPVGPAAAGDIFGGRNFGAIYGVLSVGGGIASALGAWIAGLVFDITGSYLAAFALAATCSCTAAVCMWLAAPRRVRRVAPRRP